MPRTKEEIKELEVFHQYTRLIICDQKRLCKTKNRLLIQYQEDGKWIIQEEYKGKEVGVRFDNFIKKLFAISETPQLIQKTAT